jgi:hypothetical protein
LVRTSPQATEIELFADVLTRAPGASTSIAASRLLLGALEALGSDATTLK